MSLRLASNSAVLHPLRAAGHGAGLDEDAQAEREGSESDWNAAGGQTRWLGPGRAPGSLCPVRGLC